MIVPKKIILTEKIILKFLSKIRATDGCWGFDGAITPNGYHRFHCSHDTFLAHRVSFKIFKGELDGKLVIDHVCKNRSCVNPDHLRQVEIRVNAIENNDGPAAKNKFKVKCKNGHDFTPENTLIFNTYGSVQRRCRICSKSIEREWKRKERLRIKGTPLEDERKKYMSIYYEKNKEYLLNRGRKRRIKKPLTVNGDKLSDI